MRIKDTNTQGEFYGHFLKHLLPTFGIESV